MWCLYDPLRHFNEVEATRAAFGNGVRMMPRFDRADVVLSLDSDFLYLDEGGVEATRDFTNRRRVTDARDSMNRLYVVENHYTITGGMADHRLRCAASQIGALAVALAKKIAAATGGALNELIAAFPADAASRFAGQDEWLTGCANDLVAAKGKSLVVTGARQPAAVHLLVQAINGALENIGHTLVPVAAPERGGSEPVSISGLAEAIDAKKVQTLFILGGNPALQRAGEPQVGRQTEERAHGGPPGLPRGRDQRTRPVARPDGALPRTMGRHPHGGRHVLRHPADDPAAVRRVQRRGDHQSVARPREGRQARPRARDVQRSAARAARTRPRLERVPARRLSCRIPRRRKWTPPASTSARRRLTSRQQHADDPFPAALGADEMEVVLINDYKVDDGRYANNGWLQEMPHPITKQTWDNAVLMSPATARKLGVNKAAFDPYQGGVFVEGNYAQWTWWRSRFPAAARSRGRCSSRPATRTAR